MAGMLCPKCSKSEMVDVTSFGDASNRNFLQTAPFQQKIGIDRYVCFSCGFTEEWLDHDSLEKAKKAYNSQ